MNRIQKCLKIMALVFCMALAICIFTPVLKVKAVSVSGVEQYVTRLYEKVLQRSPEADGLSYWCQKLENEGYSAAMCAQGFFESEEFTSRNLSDDEYVEVLYETLLDRSSDAQGKADWLERLNLGTTRRAILSQFTGSDEFTQLCESFGIVRGDIAMSSAVDINSDATQFVTRLYVSVLNRRPDSQGLETWVSQITSGGLGCGGVLQSFFESPEYLSKSSTNDEYVNTLYQVVMGRECSNDEREFWVSKIEDSLMSRTYVLWGFVESAEFSLLCNNYGLAKGGVTRTEQRDFNESSNIFIINIYQNTLDFVPSAVDVNNWLGYLRSGKPISDFINEIAKLESFSSMTTVERAERTYRALLAREGTQEEIDEFANAISEADFETACGIIYSSPEFVDRCIGAALIPRFEEGWNIYGDNKYYVVNGQPLVGWQRIEGVRFYFDPNNQCAAAKGWLFIDGLKYFFDVEGGLVQNVDPILGPRDTYYLTVNTVTNTIMVYAQDVPGGAYNIPVMAITCSTGTAANPTPLGDFVCRRAARWGELMGPVYGQYCSQISGNVLFHSAWYSTAGNIYSISVSEYNRLGTNASHGCVRLTVRDAMWIYNNCNGSPIHIFASGEAAPFDKPVLPQAGVVYGNTGYDTTDPATWS